MFGLFKKKSPVDRVWLKAKKESFGKNEGYRLSMVVPKDANPTTRATIKVKFDCNWEGELLHCKTDLLIRLVRLVRVEQISQKIRYHFEEVYPDPEYPLLELYREEDALQFEYKASRGASYRIGGESVVGIFIYPKVFDVEDDSRTKMWHHFAECFKEFDKVILNDRTRWRR